MTQHISSERVVGHHIALIVAAGRGLRAGGALPKQYRVLAGLPVLTHTLRAFLSHPDIVLVQVVIHPGDIHHYISAIAHLHEDERSRLAAPAHGGETRAATVRHGLEALGEQPEGAVVLIHDAARPFVSAALISKAIAAGTMCAAAIPVLPVTDTVKRVDVSGMVTGTVDRAALRAVQTPQVFQLASIRQAHADAAAHNLADVTDDGALIEWAGHSVATFPGEAGNIKLTTAEDFLAAETTMTSSAMLTTRVATGYDVHAFAEGDHVWLCGVKVPHTQGVVAHSDGDVALHALCDAIFGVIGDGDIGVHFPPSDPQWRGASSDHFLAFACERLRERGGVIDHLDISIVCERPKIGPYREAMCRRIADIANVQIDQVGLKATTSERLGFTGRSEGLAALATVTARLPRAGAKP